MTIVRASSLSNPDLRILGNNLLPAIEADHQATAARLSQQHDEHRERLYRRAGRSRAERLRRRVGA